VDNETIEHMYYKKTPAGNSGVVEKMSMLIIQKRSMLTSYFHLFKITILGISL
jgi:hypothetical protein